MSVACRLYGKRRSVTVAILVGMVFAAVAVTACKAVFVDSKCGWVALLCFVMSCAKEKFLLFGVLCPDFSPRET